MSEDTYLAIYLEDKEGNRVEAKELIQEIGEYLSGKLTDETEHITSTIVPFMKQVAMYAIDVTAGPMQTEVMRMISPYTQIWEGTVLSTVMGFIIYNIMNKRGYSIFTEEREYTAEQKQQAEEAIDTLMKKLKEQGVQVVDTADPDSDPDAN